MTIMHCPHCGKYEECRVINLNSLCGTNDQRLTFINHPDIQFYRRGRQCGVCGKTFVTDEVDDGILQEYVELREILAIEKAILESYKKKSEEYWLDMLKEALDIFRSLPIYQKLKDEGVLEWNKVGQI